LFQYNRSSYVVLWSFRKRERWKKGKKLARLAYFHALGQTELCDAVLAGPVRRERKKHPAALPPFFHTFSSCLDTIIS
jgi:hypothetical protein